MSFKPGPPKASRASRELRGNPSKRPLGPTNGFATPAMSAEPPAYLSKAAVVIWNERAPELLATGRLALEDLRLLGWACRMQAVAEHYLTEVEAGNPGQGSQNLWKGLKAGREARDIFERIARTDPATLAKPAVKGKFAGLLSA